MKVTPALKKELAQWLDTYWTTYLKGDIETWATFIRDDYRNIGSTKEEIWNSKQEIIDYTTRILDQMIGTAEIRNREIEVIPYGEYMMVNEFTDLYVKIEGKWTFYGPFRISSLLEKIDTGWIALHQHGSYPDMKALEGEAFSIDAIKAENAKLQEAVKSRTIELEIEAALERVRAVAMGMKKPEDMLDVCRIISDQLHQFGVTKIRNVQTAIIDENIGQYLCYQYFTPYHTTAVEKTEYLKSPVEHGMVKQMLASQDAYFTNRLIGKELEEFREHRKAENHFPDPHLDDAKELAYCFLSIGEGGLGLTLYQPMEADVLTLFKRFHQVFSLAYQRFRDIEKAEAQARKAQIEAAVERVRAQSMAMHHPDDLDKVNKEILTQLNWLQVQGLSGVTFYLVDEHGWVKAWDFSSPGNIGDPTSYTLQFDFKRHEMLGFPFKTLLETDQNYFVADYPLEKLEKGVSEFEEIDPTIAKILKEALSTGALTHQWTACARISDGMLGVDLVNPPSEDTKTIVLKIAGAFNQAYQRFLDLQKAEEQAKEAKIESALERVRSRSLAMHHSAELSEVVDTLLQEFTKLEFTLTFCIINLIDGDDLSNTVWAANPETGKDAESYYMKFEDYDFHRAMWNAWKAQDKRFVYTLEGEEKKIYDEYLYSETEFSRFPKHVQEANKALDRYVAGFTFFKYSGLQTVSVNEITEAELEILERFGKVFEQAYTRFLDLQKAESQSLEAQIELALERVRARTMSMHHSQELREVIQVVYDQFVGLDINVEHAGFILDYKEREDMHIWLADHQQGVPSEITIPYFDSPHWNSYVEAKASGENFFANRLDYEVKNRFYKDLIELIPPMPEETIQSIFSKPGLTISTVLLDNVGLYVENYSGVPFTTEENALLMRFGKVFQQTYTRFLDLQKAEAQAREAQIEAALERVRSRTMAMQSSAELGAVAAELFSQMNQLVTNLWTCGFVLCEKDRDEDEWWLSMDGDFTRGFFLPNVGDYAHATLYEGWLKGEALRAVQLDGESLQQHYDWLMEIPVSRTIFEEMDAAGLARPDWQKLHAAYFSKGYLVLITRELCGEEEIFKRFSQVFDQTYTRFLDLQKAEAQSREAQIETALERVRSRTMAMQNSEELPDAANILFLEVQKLGIPAWSCGYNVAAEDKNSAICWMSSEGVLQEPFKLRLFGEASFDEMGDFLRGEKTMLIQELGEKAIDDHYGHMKSFPDLKPTFDNIEAMGLSLPTYQINHLCKYTHGFLLFITYEPVPEAHDIFKRFAKVFEQTYTRFLDLQKAEAQARESQIQLAMERVRARTMAMQHSRELSETSALLFQQIQKLGVPPWSCGFNIWEQGDTFFTSFMGSPDGAILDGFKIPLTEEVTFIHFQESRDRGDKLFIDVLEGERLEAHYRYFLSLPEIKMAFEKRAQAGEHHPTFQINHLANFSHGNLLFITYEPCPEAHDIFIRFAKVFEQTYTRFLDLQKAEAQARESQIQLALERVRARTMAMHRSDELREVAALLFEQMNDLGFETSMCSIVLLDRSKKSYQNVVASHIQSVLPQIYNVPYFKDAVNDRILAAFDEGVDYKVIEFAGLELREFQEKFFMLTDFRSVPEETKQVMINMSHCSLCSAYMKHGSLETLGDKALSTDQAEILQRFAKVFEQTYTRFLDLQKAEAQAREAEIQLGLERVRARTMAMHKSSELAEVAVVMYHELKALGVTQEFFECGYVEIDEADTIQRAWSTRPDGSFLEEPFYLPLTGEPVCDARYEAWKLRVPVFHQAVGGDQFQKHNEFVLPYFDNKDAFEISTSSLVPDPVHFYCGNFSHGYLSINCGMPLSIEAESLLSRFTGVFELTYKRFLDLEKAEAQAREAQIEAALEKVRSRSMAMHTSQELKEVALELRKQMGLLGQKNLEVCAIHLYGYGEDSFESWSAMKAPGSEAEIVQSQAHFPKRGIGIIDEMMHHYTIGTKDYVLVNEGEKMAEWFKVLKKHAPELHASILDSLGKKPLKQLKGNWAVADFSGGALVMVTYGEPDVMSRNLLRRSANVFEQAYVRFLDLQKAEEQARDSQIELALERVRAKTMAIQKPAEFVDVISVIGEQFAHLGFDNEWVNFGANGLDISKGIDIWELIFLPGHYQSVQRVFIPYTDHPVFNKLIEQFESYNKNGNNFFTIQMNKKDLGKWLDHQYRETIYKEMPDEVKALGYSKSGCVSSYITLKDTWLEIGKFGTNHFTEEQNEIFKRFANAFGQAYTRFIDLQKAEAQTRESQIQLALERVRARTMAMHHSSELADTAKILFQQIKELGNEMWSCGFGIWKPEVDMEEAWMSTGDLFPIILLPFKEDPSHLGIYEASQRGESVYEVEVKGDILTKHYKWLMSQPSFKKVFSQIENSGSVLPTVQWKYAAFFKQGYLHLITTKPQYDIHDISRRFAKVFEQTYTRFLDLQKAEAQAREAQIEAALERVRARTMAMHSSEDVSAATATMFTELEKLGVENIRGGITIISLDQMQEVWSITNLADGNVIRSIGIFDMRLHSFWRELFKGWNNKEQFQHYWLAGKDKEEYIKILNETPNYLSQPIEEIPDVHIQSYFFGDGAVWANSIKPHSDEDKQIMKRFASVFSLTFRRYRDLQKAEAQAREARIEAALERVRSKTMAMHNSQDVGESVATLFDELVKLGVKTNRCGILIHNDPQFAEVWTAKSSANEKATLIIGKLEITMHPMLVGARASWVNKEPFFSFELKGQDMINYYQSINNSKYYPTQFNLEALPAKEIHSDFHFSDGSLFAFTNETLPTESAAIFKRFTSVFGQTYRRFLDLQKAEGQAREAQIEAALEKVRSRSLAMQKPEELVEVAELLRGEMGQLGVEELETSSIYLVDSENKQAECWYAIKDIRDGNKSLVSDEMTLLLSDTWVGSEMWKFFQSKKEQASIVMKGDHRKEWINYCADKSQVLQGYYGNEIPERTYHLVKFNGGYMGAASPGEISPASWDLLRRAAAVFSFAYTRFKDLQDAEARARESQIQLALERVRSRTMAMQHSDELAEAAFVLFQQLQILGVVHERINIGVVKEESKTIDFWITEQGGNQINTRFTGRMDEPTTLSKMYKGWKMNKKSMVIDLSGADLKEWLRYLKEDIGIPFDPAFSHSRRVQTVGFFSKGMLVVTTPEPLPEENLQLLEKFSGVFDLTYTRFSDLKQAEAQARDAKIEVALERIRARALAMQSSTELSEVAKVLREQMGILGQEDLEASVVHLYSSDSPTFDSWYAYRAGDQMLEGSATFRVENSALAKEFLKLYEDDVTEYTLEVKGEKLNEWLAEIKINAPKIAAYWGDLPPEKQFYHFSDFSGGALLMVSHQNLSEETRMLQKRSASVFELAYKRFLDLEAKERQDKELREEKRRLEQALSELKATQSQLVQQEKLASLGQLTAGIAHEIKNPLNFVNNFSEVSIEMMGEIKEERAKNQDARDETLVDEILDDIQANLEKIHEHGTRANGIVTSMLQHSRGSSGKMEPTNLNGLIKEYVNLSFHGMRAGKNPIDVDIALDLDPQITDVPIIKEDFTRVVINLCNNAFDAMREKILKTEDRRRETEDGDSGCIKYDPKLKVITSLENGQARISIEDNGPGIPDEIKDKILQPFFTTKKGTEGTGLGLSITNDIIKAHGGELEIETSENKGTKFIIKLTK